MDKIQINANLCKKISANKENTTLERALADKCLDLYRIVTERSSEKRLAEDCVFAIFSQIKHTSKPAAYRELARWLAEGNGEVLNGNTCLPNWNYKRIQENDAVSETMLVRKWGEKEWHKPTREYLGLEDN